MIEVRRTDVFTSWFDRLSDANGRAKIALRLDRLAFGNFGDVASVGGGVSELRIHSGSGYRIYCTQRGLTIVILLCGGDKSTQSRDIKKAQRMAEDL